MRTLQLAALAILVACRPVEAPITSPRNRYDPSDTRADVARKMAEDWTQVCLDHSGIDREINQCIDHYTQQEKNQWQLENRTIFTQPPRDSAKR